MNNTFSSFRDVLKVRKLYETVKKEIILTCVWRREKEKGKKGWKNSFLGLIHSSSFGKFFDHLYTCTREGTFVVFYNFNFLCCGIFWGLEHNLNYLNYLNNLKVYEVSYQVFHRKVNLLKIFSKRKIEFFFDSDSDF